MIGQLRRRFIAFTMVSVILVLAALMAVINVANFISRDRSSSEILSYLAENGGSFSGFKTGKPDGMRMPPGRRFYGNAPALSAESPYETRYFTVTLDEDGDLVTIDTGQIAAVDTSDAARMASTLFDAGKTTGYEGNYKYLAVPDGSDTLYVFLDCTRDLASVRVFLEISILVSLVGIAAIFLLVLGFSKRAIRPIEESYRKQKEFITNASHELKTPIAVIRSCADVLSMDAGEKQQKWVGGIQTETEKLSALVQDLVALSRMDEGATKLVRTPIHFSELVKETLSPFSLAAEAAGQRFTTVLTDGIFVDGDEKLLSQLVSILADNAVKYTPSGGDISFTLKRSGRKALLISENTAANLIPGRKDALFDRFYRADESHSKTSGQTGGYGIGLSMARSIVSAHHGKITAESPDGERLVIVVRL